jgi:hypothetical protein
LLKAQRLCQEYKTLKEHKFNHSQELKKPENADLAIEEQQLDYLEKRKVSLTPNGWTKPNHKMTEEEKRAKREALLKEMKQKHYHAINTHLEKYGARFTPPGKGRRMHSVSYKNGRVESI